MGLKRDPRVRCPKFQTQRPSRNEPPESTPKPFRKSASRGPVPQQELERVNATWLFVVSGLLTHVTTST